jgi:hypothetical protein
MERGRHRFRWLSTGLYFTMLAAVPAGPGIAPSPPDLSGTWVLNESLSQDPRGVLREAAGKAHAEEGGGGGHRGGRRGGGGGGGGFPGGGGGGGGQGRPRDGGAAAPEGDEHAGSPDLGLGAKELHITGTGTELTLAGADGADQRILYTDGRKRSEERKGLGTVKTQAQWKDGALEVVTQGPKGRTKTEIFEMTHDRKKLYVLVTLEGYGKMPAVTFRRVYDPEPAPAPAAAPPGPSLPDDDDYDLVEDF